jgi:hypothetical protein
VKTGPSRPLKQAAASITSPGAYVPSSRWARAGLSVRCCAGTVPLPDLPEQRRQTLLTLLTYALTDSGDI